MVMELWNGEMVLYLNIYKLGRIYSGQYLSDMKHGYGEMQYADGRFYKG